jgi:DNA-binding NtrC family response regulator
MNGLTGNGAQVLIVDDDEDVRQIITDRLEQAGFAVAQASDGLHALAELRQRHFHVVVTDYQMPRLNGLALLRQCQLSWPETPVIMMSAALDVPGEIAAARLAFAYIRKPFDADRLITLVCQAAHLSRAVAPPSPGSGSDTGT